MVQINLYTALRIINLLEKLNYNEVSLTIGELQEAINNPIKETNSSTYNGLIYTDDMDVTENDDKTNKKNRIGLK
nr:MAG: hypothetical protein [Bacteriophage sp.]